MSNITIYTDSTADIPANWLKENNVKCLNLTYLIDDKEYIDTPDQNEVNNFYNMLKDGKTSKTAAISIQSFLDAFEEELKAGNDVFYTGLSGKLSGTCNNAFMAMEQLNNKYSDNQVYVTDSISTSCPLYYLIYKAVEMRNLGKTPQEIVDEVDQIKHKLFAFASVSDLMHLKRGGRISGAAATVGSILNIRPVLIFEKDGSLTLKDKVKGQKKLFKYFLSKLDKYADDIKNGPVFVIHGDAHESANELKDAIIKEFGTKEVSVVQIGSVVGSHLGPGSLIISFPANCTRSEIE